MKKNLPPLFNKITIIDVARESGVSYGTVSRVINGASNVKQETRQRVQETLDKMGYVVNRSARSLVVGRSNIIGVLIPDLGSAYIGEIMKGIDTGLSDKNYDFMLYTTHRHEAKETNYIASLIQGGVDGLLLILPRNPANYLERLRELQFPYVLIDHQGIDNNGPAVGATNVMGAQDAIEYLIQLGHEKIGFITGSMDLGCARDRLMGYKNALEKNNIAFDASLVYEGDFSQPSGYNGGIALLNQANPPTALFASNDLMAFGVVDAARFLGKKVPEDISVIGFDDIAQAKNIHPSLTTIRQPLEEMGLAAAQMLLNQLADRVNFKFEKIELPTELIKRESCVPYKSVNIL